VAGLYQFQAIVVGRERLIDEAGLDSILKDVPLEGEAATLPMRSCYGSGGMAFTDEGHVHALGVLLRHILTIESLPQDEARGIAGSDSLSATIFQLL